ncbi:MAG: hypothetical protein C0483_21010 [Pirellula sp.]|nr:hypothetical protein [Pirellula sp.]
MKSVALFLGSLLLVTELRAAEPSAADMKFFETKVRPLLVTRCLECHSATKAKGGLSLDSRGGWQRGGDSGTAIESGRPDESLLIRAVEYREEGYEMPPAGKLPAAEIAILREWVLRGAPDPRTVDASMVRPAGIDIAAGRNFWAFRPVRSPAVPQPTTTDWAKRTSDRFLLSALEAKQLQPAPDAEPRRLLRRLSYDLTGLPPSADEIVQFEEAAQRDLQTAVEAAADRLLAEPQFGEKWGRHWLDLARYADSNGSSFNPPFPQAWRYRNWVIAAHNEDLPVDRFLTMQIAGDLLPYQSQAERDDNLIATGFLMLGSKVLGEFDKEQLTLDVVDEQIDVIGKAILGLTLGCARCHDHKFDPIPQRDYYALAGIFSSTVTLDDRLGGAKEDESDWSRRGLGSGNDVKLQQFLAEHRYEWVKSGQKKYELAKKIATLEAGQDGNSITTAYPERENELRKLRADLARYSARHAELESQLPPYAEAVRESATPHDEALRVRGVPSARGGIVPRGFLQVAAYADQPTVSARESGRRELAEWITSRHNPLTARVYVNHVWQRLFGEGIVRSVDNVGPRGELPTHPELLDWLARQFVDGGWRLKPLVRELVTSRAYRMSTCYSDDAMKVDPENRLLWRQNKRRLEPEEIRDTLLLAAGRLDLSPADSLVPSLPLKDLSGDDAAELGVVDPRRTVYQPIIRNLEADVLQVFDFADPSTSTGRRPVTTVAPQALYFLNSPFVQDAARATAERLAPLEPTTEIGPLVSRTFESLLKRRPTAAERQLLTDYLQRQFEGPPGPTIHDLAKLCQAIMSSTQFQFLD